MRYVLSYLVTYASPYFLWIRFYVMGFSGFIDLQHNYEKHAVFSPDKQLFSINSK